MMILVIFSHICACVVPLAVLLASFLRNYGVQRDQQRMAINNERPDADQQRANFVSNNACSNNVPRECVEFLMHTALSLLLLGTFKGMKEDPSFHFHFHPHSHSNKVRAGVGRRLSTRARVSASASFVLPFL